MKRNVKQAMFRLKDELDMFAEDSKMITVQRKDLELLIKELFFKADEWSNLSALGYAVAGAKSMGMDEIDIDLLTISINREFDNKTLEVAADIFRKSKF